METLQFTIGSPDVFETDELRAVCRVQSMPSALLVRKDTVKDWDELLTQADKKYQLDLKKTLGTRLPGPVALAPLPSPFGPSVPSSGSAATPTTSGANGRPATPRVRRKR